ncbi:hypothetical protein N7490_010750 [Penicillium lividum]|nr:hypothetical protein N7490_010750 [Penicillium lividum]
MQEPATALWGLSVSDADVERLKAGFEPQDQDDKWRISAKNQCQGDNFSIHISRAASDREFYVLFVKPSDGGSSSGAKIESITWEQNKGGIRISEEQAKKEAVIVTRCILECDFNSLPDYDVAEMWNHPAAQIGAN